MKFQSSSMKHLLLITFLFFSFFWAKAQQDAAFAIEAANSHLLKIKLGELAINTALSDSVKKLGKMLKEDQVAAFTELLEISTKLAIALPKDVDDKGQEQFVTLSKKNAEKFDKKFLKLMVKINKRQLRNIERELKRGKNLDMKAWAQRNLEVAKQQKMQTDRVCKQLKL
ncbi:MAG: DUF4142 domain-containing protein [Bacteroidetes bacterium]|nr:DUF4142 domain-containing protein [Bacteroidota bacterium]